MKRFKITWFLLFVYSVCFLTGCDFLFPQYSPGTTTTSPAPGEPGEPGEPYEPVLQCNAETLTAYASGDAGTGQYVWLGLVRSDELVAHGEGEFVTGTYEDVPVSVQVGYWSNLPGGSCQLQVFTCTDSADIGNPKARTSAVVAGLTELEAYAPQEDHSCCTDNRTYPFRKYARLHSPAASCTGANANILARYGKPCGFPDSSRVAMNATWVTVAKKYHAPQGWVTMWGQTGVAWERGVKQPATSVWCFVYWELVRFSGYDLRKYYDDTQEGVYDGFGPPSEGQSWFYESQLDTVDGTWYFTINDRSFLSQADSGWIEPGDWAQWASEIVNYEDDMAGTVSHPCVINNMQIRYGDGDFSALGFVAGDTVYSDDASLWSIERTAPDAVRLWDNDPQP